MKRIEPVRGGRALGLSLLLSVVVPSGVFDCPTLRADSGPTEETDAEESTQVPPIPREFRAAWVATVANIDWPSRPGLSTSKQMQEMIALLDCAERLHLNAIIFQVRPACDAFYASGLEPWSEYLTGRMGQAPDPAYDPLEFAVNEAHRRGIELHAWFNPFRARHSGSKSPVSPDHISQRHPELVKKYGDYLWLDPGEREATKHTLAVIQDVVKRYDINGIHLDDYFYPYPIEDKNKKKVPFPDDASWEKAQHSGRKLSRDDWRRANVNGLVRQMYAQTKRLKPWVRVGISPFGICRPGKPVQIKGFDQYEALYADAQKWFTEGWVDYLAPQLYWEIGPPEQSYPALLYWWHEHNEAARHLWPGNFTSRLLDRGKRHWPAEQLLAQIWVTRAQEGATGNVHFSMKALQQNAEGIADKLLVGPYREQALVPASTWLSNASDLMQPEPDFAVEPKGAGYKVRLNRPAPWLWVVRTRRGETWDYEILPRGKQEYTIKGSQDESLEEIVVSTVNRIGIESPLAVHQLPSP